MSDLLALKRVGFTLKLFFLTNFFFLLAFWLPQTSRAQEQPKKIDHGKIDTCFFELTQNKNKIIAKVNIFNDQLLAGAAIPLKYGNGKEPLQVDSVSFAKTRAQDFAWKHARFKEKDMANDSLQAILISLIANLGGPQPPLEKGKGTVAHIYFTLKTDKPYEIQIDTTHLPPNNTLMFVDTEAQVVPLAFKKGSFKANGKK